MTKKCKIQLVSTWNALGDIVYKLSSLLSGATNYDKSLIESVQLLLQQFQNAVIGVGTVAEHCAQLNESKELVEALSIFCEEIYQIYDSVTKGNCSGVVQLLPEHHAMIREVINDIPTHTEILFLPYKFSMWDSLESIYLAAKQDKECRTYVMPIPYVERTMAQEGEQPQEQWFYEAAAFEGIDTVSFEDYDIAEHQPDIIYIHNPYDDFNRVTSVDSRFYSSNLKQYCRELVYVPYFYSGANMPEVHRYMPSYEVIDHIVVPSEKAAEQLGAHVPKEKLLALGSPKVDRMLTMKEKTDIPGEWKELIAGRKVVLYNVSLNGLLQNGMHTVFKMKYIFDYFREHRELALLWRPHPLMKSTLRSMRPQLLGAYEEMERYYLEEQIGIYDDTPDSNRAVALADAFLGDGSSLTLMFGITGKPIYYTNGYTDLESALETRRIAWMAGPTVQDDGSILFYSWAYQTICRLDVDAGKVQLVYQMDVAFVGSAEYVVAQLDDEHVVLAPCYTQNQIGIFDRTASKVKWMEFENPAEICNVGLPIQHGGKTYFYPLRYPGILCMDNATGKLQCYDDWVESFNRLRSKAEENYFIGLPCVVGDSIFFLSYATNAILEFQTKKGKSRGYAIGESVRAFSCMAYDGQDFWLITKKGDCIVRFNPAKGILGEFTDFPANYQPLSHFSNEYTVAYCAAYYLHGAVYLAPGTANMLLRIDVVTGRIEQWKPDLPYREGQRKNSCFALPHNYAAFVQYDAEHIILQTAYDGSLYLINILDNSVRELDAHYSEEDYAKLDRSIARFRQHNAQHGAYFYMENGQQLSLADMMQAFADGDIVDSAEQIEATAAGTMNVDGTCGEKIHKAVMKWMN